MNCHRRVSPGLPRSTSPLSYRPSKWSRSTVERDDDAVLCDLVNLFDGFGLDEATNTQLNYTLGELPKCKSHGDIPFGLAGAFYFVVCGSIYGWNSIEWSIFSVNELCEPAERFDGASYGQDIPIMGQVFRIEENDTLSRQVGLGRWHPEPLYETYGDACAALRQVIDKARELEGCSSSGASLMGSLNGFALHPAPSSCIPGTEEISVERRAQGLEQADGRQWGSNGTVLLTSIYDTNGADLSTPFLGEGQLPTFDSITRWIEVQKSIPRPQGFNWACPLIGCRKVLRRPHALKDHLLFHYEIKTFQCPHPGCASTFATKCNCDRHIKSCKLALRYEVVL